MERLAGAVDLIWFCRPSCPASLLISCRECHRATLWSSTPRRGSSSRPPTRALPCLFIPSRPSLIASWTLRPSSAPLYKVPVSARVIASKCSSGRRPRAGSQADNSQSRSHRRRAREKREKRRTAAAPKSHRSCRRHPTTPPRGVVCRHRWRLLCPRLPSLRVTMQSVIVSRGNGEKGNLPSTGKSSNSSSSSRAAALFGCSAAAAGGCWDWSAALASFCCCWGVAEAMIVFAAKGGRGSRSSVGGLVVVLWWDGGDG